MWRKILMGSFTQKPRFPNDIKGFTSVLRGATRRMPCKRWGPELEKTQISGLVDSQREGESTEIIDCPITIGGANTLGAPDCTFYPA